MPKKNGKALAPRDEFGIRQGTKTAGALKLLRRKKGTTVDELMSKLDITESAAMNHIYGLKRRTSAGLRRTKSGGYALDIN